MLGDSPALRQCGLEATLTEQALDIPDLSSFIAGLWWDEGFLTEAQAELLAKGLGLDLGIWGPRFRQASQGVMASVLGLVDSDESWLPERLAAYAHVALYEPWVRSLVAGPVRAWEVARLAGQREPNAASPPG